MVAMGDNGDDRGRPHPPGKTLSFTGGIVFAAVFPVVAYTINPPSHTYVHFDPPADLPVSTPSQAGSTFPGSATSPRFHGGDRYTMIVTRPPEKP